MHWQKGSGVESGVEEGRRRRERRRRGQSVRRRRRRRRTDGRANARGRRGRRRRRRRRVLFDLPRFLLLLLSSSLFGDPLPPSNLSLSSSGSSLPPSLKREKTARTRRPEITATSFCLSDCLYSCSTIFFFFYFLSFPLFMISRSTFLLTGLKANLGAAGSSINVQPLTLLSEIIKQIKFIELSKKKSVFNLALRMRQNGPKRI